MSESIHKIYKGNITYTPERWYNGGKSFSQQRECSRRHDDAYYGHGCNLCCDTRSYRKSCINFIGDVKEKKLMDEVDRIEKRGKNGFTIKLVVPPSYFTAGAFSLCFPSAIELVRGVFSINFSITNAAAIPEVNAVTEFVAI